MTFARAILLGLLFAATVARADDERTEARAHADLARIAYGRADYRTALTEFHKAYDAAPVPDLLYNIGRCHDALGERSDAIAAYRKYLAAKPDAEDRDAVNARIRELETAPPAAPPPPTPTVTSPTSAPSPVTTQASLAVEKPAATPWYRRWWPWTIAAVVVVAAVVTGVVLGTASSPSEFPAVMVQR